MSRHSLTMHKTGVCREMVLGFLARNELVASPFAGFLRASSRFRRQAYS